MTPRQQLIKECSEKVARHNYKAWRLEIDDPLPETLEMIADVQRCGGKRLVITPYATDNIYPELFKNSLGAMIDERAGQLGGKVWKYYDEITDRAFYRLALAILREARKSVEWRKDIYYGRQIRRRRGALKAS